MVDVGGNVGIFALYAKSKGCHVVTFEPVPDLAACIRQNIPDAKIFEVAVSDKNGEVKIDFLPNYTMLSGLNAGANRDVYKSVAQDVGMSTIEIEGLECVVSHVTRNNHGDSKW